MTLRRMPLIALVAAASMGCAKESAVTVETVRSDLQANLPLGSPVERVVAHVNERGYTSDGALSAANIKPSILNPDVLELRSIIRDVRKVWPVSYSISMRFTFGPDRKLTGIEVEEVGTGP